MLINTDASHRIKCPACPHSRPATASDLGLQSCPSCGLAVEVTWRPVAWQYAAVAVTTVKADDDTAGGLGKRLPRGGRGDPPRRL